MAFACQRNSYLKELVSKVVSCVRVKEKFEVVLSDTVLFPEGGGQVRFLLISISIKICTCSLVSEPLICALNFDAPKQSTNYQDPMYCDHLKFALM